ncbi:MAG TPA: transaminase [Kineosporiaceae bacterium]|nr:transaminase [Kineosporiaceae bacterium]
MSVSTAVDRTRLAALVERERRAYAEAHPASRALFADAGHLFGRVPMTWMNKWSGGFPLYLERARGSRVVDVDGHEYVDLALGDTGAMAGHSPEPTVDAVIRRIRDDGGLTTMLPTADAAWVGAELTRRFGLPLWSFTLTATDANRWVLRLARLATGRPKVLVFAYCYHGSVDEAFAVPGPDGEAVARPGNVGAPVPLAETTRVAEFNDLAGVEEQLAHGDVAAILTEPALTNIGIVLPEPGFHEGLRELATRYGALLIIDETHTFSAGPGGATAAWGLQPDLFVIGKSIGGGIASGAYGISADVAAAVSSHPEADLVDVGGVGGTLAGNALSVAAMRATLEHVLTDEAFAAMIARATRYTDGLAAVIDKAGLPWSVSQLGARSEFRFASPAPRTGSASAVASDDELDEYLHLYLANRGVLMTPFHSMALMSPATTDADVDRAVQLFGDAVEELTRQDIRV